MKFQDFVIGCASTKILINKHEIQNFQFLVTDWWDTSGLQQQTSSMSRPKVVRIQHHI